MSSTQTCCSLVLIVDFTDSATPAPIAIVAHCAWLLVLPARKSWPTQSAPLAAVWKGNLFDASLALQARSIAAILCGSRQTKNCPLSLNGLTKDGMSPLCI